MQSFGTRKKTIELRKWNTNFRGKFLIHASKNVNKEKCKCLGIDHTKLKHRGDNRKRICESAPD